MYKPRYSQFCLEFCCHGNGVRSGKNAIGSIRWPIPENPKNIAKMSYTNRVIATFVPNFVAMATRVNRRKMRLAAFDNLSRKPQRVAKYRKNLLRKPSYSQFCLKFRCHSNRGRLGKNAIGNIRWPIPETPPLNLGAKISYASRVIAHFVPNFVAMATGVGRGKMRLAAFDGPSPKTPL